MTPPLRVRVEMILWGMYLGAMAVFWSIAIPQYLAGRF